MLMFYKTCIGKGKCTFCYLRQRSPELLFIRLNHVYRKISYSNFLLGRGEYPNNLSNALFGLGDFDSPSSPLSLFSELVELM